MLDSSSLTRLRELTNEVCQREGVILYDIEVVAGSRGVGRTLRIFVDRDRAQAPVTTDSQDSGTEVSGGTGASLEDCANVSRGLSLLLDVDDIVDGGQYQLEVSTPGLDRPLKELWHFEKVIGKKVEIKTSSPLESFNPEYAKFKNRSKVTGRLVKVEGVDLFLDTDFGMIQIPLNQVAKSNVIPEFSSPAQPGNHKNKNGNFKNKVPNQQKG
jgi:ribosome maturation factor RimP